MTVVCQLQYASEILRSETDQGQVAAEPLRLVLRARAIVIRVLLRGRTVDFLKILPRRPLIRIVAAMRNTNNSHKAASVGI